MQGRKWQVFFLVCSAKTAYEKQCCQNPICEFMNGFVPVDASVERARARTGSRATNGSPTVEPTSLVPSVSRLQLRVVGVLVALGLVVGWGLVRSILWNRRAAIALEDRSATPQHGLAKNGEIV